MIDPTLVGDLHAVRERFLELVAHVRPDLHRYCTRMVGSIGDAEDIVQDTLARAYFALPEIESITSLRSWLFQIAHNRALDFLRSYPHRMSQPLESIEDTSISPLEPPDDTLAFRETVGEAMWVFMELNPSQRSCVILKDVLGCSVDDIAALLSLNVPAVKALLHRGRARLRSAREKPRTPIEQRTPAPEIQRYITLFNARDWDGVRDLLADDVRLDLVSRSQRAGRRDVGGYLTNYNARRDWFLVPAWLDGVPVVAAFRDRSHDRPSYFIELTIRDHAVAAIRDFRYVPYIARDAVLVVAPLD
jgi:RNA polymerase sigma-70 factor (ECF subfamily)